MEKYPDVDQIHSELNLQKTLGRLVGANILHPIILQELAVMHHRLPGHFEKALFCSWLAVLTATKLELPDDLLRVAFIAGLVADRGLLHISPDILMKKTPLDEAKIIMTTGLSDSISITDAFYKGEATSYIVKPVTEEKLVEKMRSLDLISAKNCPLYKTDQYRCSLFSPSHTSLIWSLTSLPSSHTLSCTLWHFVCAL